MLLKDQRVKRPSKTKIFKRGKDKYVYHIKETFRKDNIKHLAENRVLIGKMIDDDNMIPNDNFEKYYPGVITTKCDDIPIYSDTVDVGTYTLIDAILKGTNISDILNEIFVDKSDLIKDLISYILVKESCVFEYYPYYARRVITYSNKIYSDSYISKLLKEGISLKQIEEFLNEWNKLNKDINDVYINVDSTNFNVNSDYDGLSDFGHAKDDKDKPQINLSYLSRADNNRPLSYELYNGSINDTGEIIHLINTFNKYGYSNIGFIFDRGYYSLELIKKLQKEKRFFIMMLKDNFDYVQDIIMENRDDFINPIDNYFSDYELSYVSKKVNISKSKNETVSVNCHIYYDVKRAADQKATLLNAIETYEKEINSIYNENKLALKDSFDKYNKYFDFTYTKEGYLLSYNKNKQAIKNEINSYGYFALLSSKDIDAKSVLTIYRSRDGIEKLFRALKTSFDFDHPSVHYKSSLESKVFITFLAIIIRNEICIKLRELSINERKLYTFPFIMNELNSIEASKNINNKYYRRYALTAKQKKILTIYKLKEKDIESSISYLNSKPVITKKVEKTNNKSI